jgi:Flp pilus assembly protein TadD
MVATFRGPSDLRLPPKAREAEQRESQGDHDSAVRLYEEAAKAYPQNWFVLLQLAEVYYRLGRYQEAVGAYARSNAGMENAFAYGGAGRAYEQLSNRDAALHSYQKMVQTCPEDPDLDLRLSRFYYLDGSYDEAAQTAETGLTKPPFRVVANPAPGTVEQLDALTKEQLRQVLADVDVARGRYAEASKRLGQMRIIGALITMTDEGARLVRIKKGYGAEMAGLKDGDVLVALNGESLAGAKPDEFIAKLDNVPFGSTATVTFSRNGNQSQTTVVVGVPEDLPALARQARGAPAEPSVKVQGVEVRPDHVVPGAPYDVVVTFVVTDPTGGSGTVSAEYSYQVLAGEKVLYTRPGVTLEEPNGAVRQRTEHLTAIPNPGKYTFQAIVRYKGLSAEKSADFQIEAKQ